MIPKEAARISKPVKHHVEKHFGPKTESTTIDTNLRLPWLYLLLCIAATLPAALTAESMPQLADQANATTEWHTPTYAIFKKSSSQQNLVHIKNVLHRFGYQQVDVDADWDLLWAFDYPYVHMPRLKHLHTHQLVNHIPGCGYLTSKVDLSTTQLPFMPRAFRLPNQSDEFLAYARAHPEAMFVQKHNKHRQIQIRTVGELVSSLTLNGSFVQEFIQRPFLVDGHKFDIGVYVVITSINPLRAYMYTGDVMFRYCALKYNPLDPENLDQYIVGDRFLPSWELPSIRKYFKQFGGSMRASFEAYVRDQAMDPAVIWPQVEHILRTTILAKEQQIINVLRAYETHNFFELMRFDLLIDEDLKVQLMEINMSPNLSSARLKPNAIIFEQVLYSVFNLVGVRPVVTLGNSNMFSNDDDSKFMITADKNLATGLSQCAAHNCNRSCNRSECSLCLPCLSQTEYKLLQQAHREHLHRVDMKRIFPTPIHNFKAFDIASEIKSLSEQNAWMTRWFYNKCEFDGNWCT